ncbi:MAG: RtcB family protein [bacterium]
MTLPVEKINDYTWRLPRQGTMRVDGIVYASEKMMASIREDMSLNQLRNVATLPGIVSHALAMPDVHWGYGFPIGGVAAFDEREGVVSPGGVGYDINCGVRLLRTGLRIDEIRPRLKELVLTLFQAIPTGVGSHHRHFKLSREDQKGILRKGAHWAVTRGYGDPADLEHIEEKGCLSGADPEQVSERAYERGKDQLGTLGSGNHFLEIGYVDEVYDEKAAHCLGLASGSVTVIIHTGSRGLGHQTCDDYLETMIRAGRQHKIELPDPQLACAPLKSEEGRRYLAAMAAGANFAFANRQMITHLFRETLERFFGRSPQDLEIRVIYDVCHNIAKFEEHLVGGVSRRLCVHRKGATRAFPPKHPQIPTVYREIGQPVLIPGDMGRYSFVLLGTQNAYENTFGSTCHGAGRVMSRNQAKRSGRGRNLEAELAEEGIFVRGASRATITEEAPWAYKDVADVVEVVHQAGISRKVARLRPLGVIKG